MKYRKICSRLIQIADTSGITFPSLKIFPHHIWIPVAVAGDQLSFPVWHTAVNMVKSCLIQIFLKFPFLLQPLLAAVKWRYLPDSLIRFQDHRSPASDGTQYFHVICFVDFTHFLRQKIPSLNCLHTLYESEIPISNCMREPSNSFLISVQKICALSIIHVLYSNSLVCHPLPHIQ